MTDNEIIKALECCADATKYLCVERCSLYDYDGDCCGVLKQETLSLINRQKAEIERLRGMNHKCIYYSDEETTEYCVEGPCIEHTTLTELKAEIKAGAIKEFAERLKARCYPWETYGHFNSLVTSVECIDNLVKEMVGDGDG